MQTELPGKIPEETKDLIRKLTDLFTRIYTDMVDIRRALESIETGFVGTEINIGDPLTDGCWRFKRVSGNDFQLQHRVSGVWVKEAQWTPS